MYKYLKLPQPKKVNTKITWYSEKVKYFITN